MSTNKGKAKPSEQLKHDAKRIPRKDHYVLILHIQTEHGRLLPSRKRVRLHWPYALVHKLTLEESEKTPWEASDER